MLLVRSSRRLIGGSEVRVEGLGSAIMRGFEPFRLASTSVPIFIGVLRSGTGENSSSDFGFSGHGERSLILMSLLRLYGSRLVTIR